MAAPVRGKVAAGPNPPGGRHKFEKIANFNPLLLQHWTSIKLILSTGQVRYIPIHPKRLSETTPFSWPLPLNRLLANTLRSRHRHVGRCCAPISGHDTNYDRSRSARRRDLRCDAIASTASTGGSSPTQEVQLALDSHLRFFYARSPLKPRHSLTAESTPVFKVGARRPVGLNLPSVINFNWTDMSL
ncbi:hypothetical protein BIW11_13056 [Tropilaelaps mercedesae]|uniref:Uncharacterized protein n=1 Tax=Tropilaelaps mercedesae TaxID=418985 RepID=A0A1V9X3Q8_9ACAR|nr:hypothetical protein BIW11_13056 [Tropilaelaps mercedesae]